MCHRRESTRLDEYTDVGADPGCVLGYAILPIAVLGNALKSAEPIWGFSFTADTGGFDSNRLLKTPLRLDLTHLPPFTPPCASTMEGMNHGGHGGVRPPHSALAPPGFDVDSHMMSDDFAFGSPFSPADSHNQDGLLQDPLFPEWKTGAPRGGESPEEMQRQDPLAAQIWRLYTRTKTQLPNQERMENLTWRMMAMSLKRKEREQQRYGGPPEFPHDPQ